MQHQSTAHKRGYDANNFNNNKDDDDHYHHHHRWDEAEDAYDNLSNSARMVRVDSILLHRSGRRAELLLVPFLL